MSLELALFFETTFLYIYESFEKYLKKKLKQQNHQDQLVQLRRKQNVPRWLERRPLRQPLNLNGKINFFHHKRTK